MPDSSIAELNVLGYYSHLYNSITQPGQVWRVSKYFLRRWGPYLGPTRFWTIITARQLCYRNGDQDWFAGYDAAVANEVHLSRAHYRRLKNEMEHEGGPLSLFINRQPTTYHVVNGKTRPQPTVYRVRLDDPLTPADGAFLAGWLRQQAIKRRAADVTDLLRQAVTLSRQELLEPFPAPAGVGGPAVFEPITVPQVVRQVFGGHVADQPEVVKAAEALHAHLAESDFVGKQYFRQQWLRHLKAGPAFLQVYLRSLCYYNEQSGELRNRIVLDRQQLAQTLAVKPNTISDWLKTLATSGTGQPFPPFITLLEKGRTADNSYTFTYECGMIDPLTPDDLTGYETATAARPGTEQELLGSQGESENELHKEQPGAGSRSENELHGKGSQPTSQYENERHKGEGLLAAQSENEPHVPGRSKNELHQSDGQSEIESHSGGVNPNLRAANEENEPGSIRECVPFKYFSTLLTLQQEDLNTWLAAAGGETFLENGHRTLTEFICDEDFSRLSDFLAIDPGSPTRRRLANSGLTPDDGVGWWLYARTQPSLKRPAHFVIARTVAGIPPPEPFAALATLPVEGWVSFAITGQLPVALQPDWSGEALFESWCEIYGAEPLTRLPELILTAAASLVDAVYERRLTVDETGRSNPSAEKIEPGRWWRDARETLAANQPAALYDIFIAPLSAEIDEVAGRVKLLAPDETGRAFLEQGLRRPIEQALAEAAGFPVTLTFGVTAAVGEGAGKSVESAFERDRLLWLEVKDALALQMTRATYEQWLKSSVLSEAADGAWLIEVDTEAARAWVNGRLRPQIEKTARLIAGRPGLDVTFGIAGAL